VEALKLSHRKKIEEKHLKLKKRPSGPRDTVTVSNTQIFEVAEKHNLFEEIADKIFPD
jgi:hypothetical protein